MSKQTSVDGTVGKALEILDLIASFGRPVRFSEILTNSPHPKATLYRLVQTLTNQGMLSFDNDRATYQPGIRLVRLAHSAWRQSALAPVARPILDRLAKELGETLHLAQMDEGQVLYVDKRNAAQPIEMFSSAGKSGPGYCTGVGKAIMAFLPTEIQERAIAKQSYYGYTPNTITTADTLRTELDHIAKNGMAFDREEHEPGIICIAVPVLNSKNHALGALSLTSNIQRHSFESLKMHASTLQTAASEISHAAENWQFPT
ncbi:MAG: IclR family transcriptional regulator [Marinovum sp.]|jgi:IclR family KDG regulon transcriptional repressor|nr:IclR family transcriptional regulator [Marinovum sp.]MDG2231336.1 IclR family transcriptional regulator [Paracoccaceae bacterium]MBT4871808.1 IclR family transcriptional regulator [Marinovum sp.]MBT6096772.1 IclR family transcriptional regulator [Marinovum sp.]MBT6507048.1 IclR family transcriptional regulator [Marinovum sp.]